MGKHITNKKKPTEKSSGTSGVDASMPPVPKQFLAHQGTLTAIRETDLQTEKEAFSAVPFKDLAEGTFCYAVYGVNDSEDDEETSTSWGFLAKVIAVNRKTVRLHFVDCHHMTGSVNTEYSADITGSDLTDTAYVQRQSTPIPNQPSPSSNFEELIKADKTIARLSSEQRENRVKMLNCALNIFIKTHAGKNLSAEESQTKAQDAVTEAMANLRDFEEAKQEGEHPPAAPATGDLKANAKIVVRVFKQSRDKTDFAGRLDAQDAVLAKMCKMMENFQQHQQREMVISTANKAPQQPPKKTANMTSMTGNGKCAWEAAGKAILAVEGASAQALDNDLSEADRDAASAKAHFTTNILQVQKELQDEWSIGENAHERHLETEELFRTLLGQTAESILNVALQGKKWGGQIELAFSAWHTSVLLVIIDANHLHKGSSDIDLKKAVFPAMLVGLPAGPEKTRKAFCILQNGHYSFGYTKQGSEKTVIFADGEEADEAQHLILQFLKNRGVGPLSALDAKAQLAEIQQRIEQDKKQRKLAGTKPPPASYAKALGGTAAPNGTKAKPIVVPGAPSSRSNSVGKASKRSRSRTPRSSSQKPSQSRASSASSSMPPPPPRAPKKPAAPPVPAAGKEKTQPRGVLRVYSNAKVHAALWRANLNKIDKETGSLLNWVTHSKKWYYLDCEQENVEALVARADHLRASLNWSVEIVKQRKASPRKAGSDGNCADWFTGNACSHSPAHY